MGNFIQLAFELLTTPPGNLAYHLLLTFAIFGAFQAAYFQWHNHSQAQFGRQALGLALLLALRFLLIGAAMLAWMNLLQPQVLAPPLERGVNTLSLAILTWLWAFPQPDRKSDLISALVGLGVVAIGLVNVALWMMLATSVPYNQSLLDLAAAVISVALGALGLAVLAIRRPQGWTIGAAMLGMLLIGDLAHLFAPDLNSHLPGAVRLAQIVAYPLLFALPQRFSPPPAETPQAEAPPFVAEQTFDHLPFAQIWLNLAVEDDPAQVRHLLVKGVGMALRADLCLLVSAGKLDKPLTVQCGYDTAHLQRLEDGKLRTASVPGLASVIHRGHAIQLNAEDTPAILSGFADYLNLPGAGCLLAAPVSLSDSVEPTALVLLTPYSRREWSPEEQRALEEIIAAIQPVLQIPHQQAEREAQLEQMLEQLEAALVQLKEAEEQNQVLLGEIDALRQEADRSASAARTIALMTPGQAFDAPSPDTPQPGTENRGGEELEHAIGELRLALGEVASLKNALAQAQQRIDRLQEQSEREAATSQQPQWVTSFAQRLRQPMTSILGYSELLLGESVGILGALQRKFLQRIVAAVERMDNLLTGFVRSLLPEAAQSDLAPQKVNLGNALDEAINATRRLVRRKDIVLRVDLPRLLPQLQTDQDALQQILIHLLENAVAATPEEREVYLRVAIQERSDGGEEYVLLQVQDSGVGIPPEELGRVFSRFYRSENPDIPGVGDRGVGLSIAKALTETLGGRIWVDSQAGRGATFSVLLPLTQSEEEGGPRWEERAAL